MSKKRAYGILYCIEESTVFSIKLMKIKWLINYINKYLVWKVHMEIYAEIEKHLHLIEENFFLILYLDFYFS